MKFRALSILLVLFAAISLSGCGASGSGTTPSVSLAILSPMDGATVGAHRVTITGTVTPINAAVYIGGQPISVVNGSYQIPVTLSKNTEKITLTGVAKGYLNATASTTVQYSADAAANVAEASLGNPALQGSSSGSRGSGVSASSLYGAPIGKPKAGGVPVTRSSSPSAAPTRTQRPSSSAKHPVTPPPITPRVKVINPPSAPSVNRPSHGGAKHHAAHKRQPTLTTASKNKHKRTATRKTAGRPTTPLGPVLTVADIRQAWIATCLKAGKDQSYAPYCRCTYRHLARSGWLSSRDRLLALERKLAPYNRTHNPNRLPRFVRRAIFACASKLPPLDPMTGKPTIVKLRGLSHGRHSARQVGDQPQVSDNPAGSAAGGSGPIATTGPLATIARSAVHEFNIALRLITRHKPATSAPSDHRSVRKSHRRAAAHRRAPERRHHWAF